MAFTSIQVAPDGSGKHVANWSILVAGVTYYMQAVVPTDSSGNEIAVATAAQQAAGNASLTSLDGKTPALGQAAAAASVPVVLTAEQLATLTPLSLAALLTQAEFDSLVGSLTETAPGTDVASSGLNGRLQRIAQRLTSLIAALGSPLQAGGTIAQNTDVRQATASNFNAQVVGNIASAGTDSGNPVKAGGVYNSTLPTYTTGQRGDHQIGTRGSLSMTLFAQNSSSPASIGNLGDGNSTQVSLYVNAQNAGYNGANWDRLRVANVQKDLSAVSVNSIVTVWTPASGKKVRLMGGTITASTALSVLFEDNSGGTTVFRTATLLANTPYEFRVNGGQGYLLAAANNVLKATGSINGTITGTLWGTEE